MNQSKFAVTRFENRNGSTSWRVDGRLHGVRFRKNFKTREEAAAEKSALEIKAAQTAHGMQTVATSLTANQVREAEAVFQRLRSRLCPISFYVDFALSKLPGTGSAKEAGRSARGLQSRQRARIGARPTIEGADAPHSVGNEAADRSFCHADSG
jgi:hypothetical protein